jgi:carbon monoxide dehydrogenase subunit G
MPAIRFEGTESFPAPPADVFAKLADAGWLARALPEAEVTETAPDRAAWKVRPKFAFMAGNLDTTAEVLGRAANEQVRYRIVSTSVGAHSTVDARLEFGPADGGGTAVKWVSDVTELGGLLKLVPRGLIQAAAQKVITDVWAAIRQRLAD